MLFTALITILNQFKQEQKLNKGITLASEKSLSVTTVLSEDVDGWVESTASTTTTSLERRWFRVTRQRRGRRERGLWRPPVEEPKRPRQRASPWCREGHSGACPVLRDAHRGNGAAALIDMLLLLLLLCVWFSPTRSGYIASRAPRFQWLKLFIHARAQHACWDFFFFFNNFQETQIKPTIIFFTCPSCSFIYFVKIKIKNLKTKLNRETGFFLNNINNKKSDYFSPASSW